MEPETPESYKKFLIKNAENLDKQYIDAQKVTWHKNGHAYTYIHQEERDKLLIALVFYCTSDQIIYKSYFTYEIKDHPIYPLPHNNALPQFNDNDEAYFHADGYTNNNLQRTVILFILPTNSTTKSKAIPCRIGLSSYMPDHDNYYCDKVTTYNSRYLLPFQSLLTALLNSSKKHVEYTHLYLQNKTNSTLYAQDDQAMVYYVCGTLIPKDYALCTTCKHFPRYYDGEYTTINHFEDLPQPLTKSIIEQYIRQFNNETVEKNSSYNKPQKPDYRIAQTGPQRPTNINDVLKDDALLIKELIRRSANKNKHSKRLYQAEETLLQAFHSNIFKYYSAKTREDALTIINNIIARDAIIESIQNNNIRDFTKWTTSNPAALNIHSPLLNDGTPVHLIVHRIAHNDYNTLLEITIKHNANLNRLDKYGRTPLFYAIINKNVAIAQQLIKNGASTRLKDHTKNTLMHYAVCQNIQDNNLNKQKEIINFCLKNTQELNAKNNFGNTPVHLALLGNIHQELLEILFLNVSINFSLKNKQGETLQSILKKKPEGQNHERITQLIDATLEQKTKCSCTEKFK